MRVPPRTESAIIGEVQKAQIIPHPAHEASIGAIAGSWIKAGIDPVGLFVVQDTAPDE